MEPLDLRETLAGCLLEIPVPNLLNGSASKICQLQFDPPVSPSKELTKADLQSWEIPLNLPANLPSELQLVPRSELKVAKGERRALHRWSQCEGEVRAQSGA